MAKFYKMQNGKIQKAEHFIPLSFFILYSLLFLYYLPSSSLFIAEKIARIDALVILELTPTP